jgi:hypothetical protein
MYLWTCFFFYKVLAKLRQQAQKMSVTIQMSTINARVLGWVDNFSCVFLFYFADVHSKLLKFLLQCIMFMPTN